MSDPVRYVKGHPFQQLDAEPEVQPEAVPPRVTIVQTEPGDVVTVERDRVVIVHPAPPLPSVERLLQSAH